MIGNYNVQMSDFNFYSGLIISVLIYWSLLYFLFHVFRKDKVRPVYKSLSYWLTSIISTISLYAISLITFLYLVFRIADYTDSSIVYGTEIIGGHADGIMHEDWIHLYDNKTFHILSYQVESNGYYEMKNDTIELKYNQNYEETVLPGFIVLKYDTLNNGMRHLSMYGYRVIDGKPDNEKQHYFSSYENLK